MSKNKELRYQPAKELRIQPNPDGSRTLSGYAIVYNSPSSDIGGFSELVAPGAVTESLANNPDVLCLRDHRQELLIGRTKAKTLSLTEDLVGLRFRCDLPDTTQAADLAASIERGDLDGVSFGFTTIEDKWTSDGAGNVVRTLLKINLFEISPCSFPAYRSSSASVRSCPPELRTLLRSRIKDEEDDDECDCACPECLDGDCEDCSDPDCEDPNCDHGDRSSLVSKSERHRMHMRLTLASHK